MSVGHGSMRLRFESMSTVRGLLIVLLIPLMLAGCAAAGVSATVRSESPTTTPGVTLSTEHTPVGIVLATGSGRTLYDFALDSADRSACVSTTCAVLWPPLDVTGTPTLSPSLNPSLLGTIRRPDGSLQLTYGDHPLYTWVGDTQPGMVTGQALANQGGRWYVVAPSGRQITTNFTITG
jgi:predicted lipoprotein with Yx(FWY)xxD motif